MGIETVLFILSTAYQISQYNKQQRELDKLKGQNIKGPSGANNLPIVYGKQAISGFPVKYKVQNGYTSATENSDSQFAQNFANSTFSGEKNKVLIQQSALCYEGIEGVQHVLVDDIDYRGTRKEMEENNSKFQHRITIHNNGGTYDAAAFANGIPNSNKFTKAAYATNFFNLNRDNPQYRGAPNITYLVKGRKVRKITDNGGGSYTLNSTYEYSNNPAYCLLDYLLNNDFGRGLTTSEIDLESFYNAASVCDSDVVVDAMNGGQVNGIKPIFAYSSYSAFPTSDMDEYHEGYLYFAEDTETLYSVSVDGSGIPTYSTTTSPGVATVKLYECNMTLDTEESLRDNITRFLDCMGQASFLWNSEGKYKLLVSYPENETETANLVDSKHSFTEDDIVRESVQISWPRAGERFNHVTVSFNNEFENFKSDTVSWPNLTSATYATYLGEDNDIPAHTSLYPDGVVNKFQALAYAEEKVRRSRSSYTISFVTTRKGLTVEPGDIITLQSNNLGLASAEYIKVESVKINYDFTVEITGYKFDYTTLAWNVEDDIAYSVIRDVDFEIPLPTNVSFSTTTDNLGTASGKVTWTGVEGISSPEYIVEGSSDNGTTWFMVGITRSTSIDVTGLQTANYQFSVRTKTISGSISNRVTTTNQSVQLKTVGQVKPIYADDSSGTNKTVTLTDQKYVLYWEYDGDFDINDVTGTWAKFVGDDGADGATGPEGPQGPAGADGATGSRGAGWWRYEDSTTSRDAETYYGTTSPDQTEIDAAWDAATGGNLDIVQDDRFIIACTDTDTVVAYIQNSSGNWVYQAEFIDGNLLVNGTITGTKVAAGTITAGNMNVTSLAAINANLGSVTINEALTMENAASSFVGGKNAAGDIYTPGYYFGRKGKGNVAATSFKTGKTYEIITVGSTDFVTDFGADSNDVGEIFISTADGSGASGSGTAREIGFELTVSSDGATPSAITISDDRGINLINPTLWTGAPSSSATVYSVDGKQNIGVVPSITVTAVGGGGGGGRGSDRSWDSAFSPGGDGTATTVQVYDGDPDSGGTLYTTITATGGSGGLSNQDSLYKVSGTAGESSPYGNGGAGGGFQTNGGNGGIGAGGGGGGYADYMEFGTFK